MTKTEASKVAFAGFRIDTLSASPRFCRALADLARDCSRAWQAAALAEADPTHPARIKALFG